MAPAGLSGFRIAPGIFDLEGALEVEVLAARVARLPTQPATDRGQLGRPEHEHDDEREDRELPRSDPEWHSPESTPHGARRGHARRRPATRSRAGRALARPRRAAARAPAGRRPHRRRSAPTAPAA